MSSIENFVAFGAGPRMCLGRKFSTVEAVCFLTHVIRDWKVDIKLDKDESAHDWQTRVLQPTIEVTLKNGVWNESSSRGSL